MQGKLHIIDLGFVNAYLIETGGTFILIDTGAYKQYARITTQLSEHGCVPGLLKLIILTHGDPDHAGNAKQLRKEYGAPIALHEGDGPMIERGRMPDREGTTFLMKWIMSLSKLQSEKTAPETFWSDLYLTDAQVLTEYGSDALVLHTPGHTKGSICVLTSNGDLIAGDTLINISRPSGAALIENAKELSESLGRIKKLPVTKIYPGHGKSFSKDKLNKI